METSSLCHQQTDHFSNSQPKTPKFPSVMTDHHAFNKVSDLASKNAFDEDYVPAAEEVKEVLALKEELNVLDEESFEAATVHMSTRGRQAIRSILFPAPNERQCVLLKRAPILLNRKKEQELCLFTTGILLINMDLDQLLDNSLAALKISDGKETSFSPEILRKRFEEIDKDGSGSLDIDEVHELFHDMGFPISKNTLEQIIQTIDADSDGQITYDEFEQAFQRHENNDTWKKDADVDSNKDSKTPLWGFFSGNLSTEVKTKKKLPKLDNAYVLGDIESVEGADAFFHDSKVLTSEEEADNSFGIHVKGKRKPLLTTCVDAEECDEWLDIFQTCFDSTRRRAGKDKRNTTVDPHNGWDNCESIDWGDE